MVSIKDVAKEAGVSTTTVSAVVRNLGIVKPVTQQKVLDAIEKLGYIPSVSARELVTRHKQNIGFISMVYDNYDARMDAMDIGTDMFYHEYFRGIAKSLLFSGYGLLYENYHYTGENKALPKMIEQQRVDYVFLVSGLFTDDFVSRLQQHVAGVVSVGGINNVSDCVRTDYVQSIYDLTKHIIDNGHRRIAFVVGDSISYAWPHKLKGFKLAMADAQLKIDENLIFSSSFIASAGYAIAEQIVRLSAKKMPTAIVFGSDMVALGAYRYFQKHGIRIPENISIVGYENSIVSGFVSPPLTTVDFNKMAMGIEAGNIMLERIRNPKGSLKDVILPYKIIYRESVRSL